MWTSSTAAAAPTAEPVASGPAQRSTSIGRSRLPPASSVALASARSPGPAVSIPARRRSSTAAMPRGSHDDAESRTCVTGGGTRRARHGLVAVWMAMMPPARTT